MVESSEEASKEKYFRDNEQDYTVSKTFLYNRGVMALIGSFTNNISSSLIYSKCIG